MDEQATPVSEPAIITPDPVVVDTPATEPPQVAEVVQAPAEPATVPETPVPSMDAATPLAEDASLRGTAGQAPQTEQVSEQTQTIPEPPTPPRGVLHFSNTDDREEKLVAQMEGNEVLLEVKPEPISLGAGAIAEAPKTEAPTALPTLTPEASPSEVTPPKAEESPQTPTPSQTQQGTAQPEPPPSASPVPAQGPQGPLPFSKTDDRQENLVAQTSLPQSRNLITLLLRKAQLTIQLRKQKKLLKVMALFAKKSHITNNDVAKLLHVSDATALRYLTQLEKENKITQMGKTGHAVTYTKR